ncbi:hypothetical protein D3C76_1661440 [compost metagenome]
MVRFFVFLDRLGCGLCDNILDYSQSSFASVSAKMGRTAKGSQKYDMGAAKRIQLCISA